MAAHRTRPNSGSSSRGVWKFSHPVFGEATIEPPVRVWTDNADLLNPALIAGQGVALQPEFLVWQQLRAGQLEIGIPEWSTTPLGLHLMTPPSPLRPLRVQVLIDFLVRELSHVPWSSEYVEETPKPSRQNT